MMGLKFVWTVSRARDTAGYNICSLWVDGRKVSSCNGGGYDMQGTCLGLFLARSYADRLMKLAPEVAEKLYGLSYHDPDFDPGKAVVGAGCDDRTFGGAAGQTVEQAEKEGKSCGLERYQAFYKASSHVPTERHKVPLIDGACGFESVRKIAQEIGIELEWVPGRVNRGRDVYILHDKVA